MLAGVHAVQDVAHAHVPGVLPARPGERARAARAHVRHPVRALAAELPRPLRQACHRCETGSLEHIKLCSKPYINPKNLCACPGSTPAPKRWTCQPLHGPCNAPVCTGILPGRCKLFGACMMSTKAHGGLSRMLCHIGGTEEDILGT